MSVGEVLDKRHVISAILFIHRNPGCKKTDLYDATSRNAQMPRRLDELESMGLLSQNRSGLTGTTILRLTGKGTRIAEHLERMESILGIP